MQYVRHAIACKLFIAMLNAQFAIAQSTSPPPTIEPLLREAIEAAPGLDLSVSTLTVVPGFVSNSHSHPGETFVYVLEGRILNQIGSEEPKVYEAGDFFFEHANATHARFENLDTEKRAVVLIFGIRPEGEN